MITLNQLTDLCIAQASGAVVNDESKFTNEMVQKLIHQARADLIASLRVKSLPSIVYQRYYPTYSEIEQLDPCTVEFRIPDVINRGARGDGLSYVGNRNEQEPFERLGKGAQKNIYYAHRVTNPNNRSSTMWIDVLDPTGYMKLQIINNVEIEDLVAIAVFANPTDMTYFRPDTDIYPVSAEMIDPIIQIVSQSMLLMAATPADTLSNSADTPSQAGTQIPIQRGRRR
jgi:hypothetical protein